MKTLPRLLGAAGTYGRPAGTRSGTSARSYLDDESGHPSWVTVKTGLFGTRDRAARPGRCGRRGRGRPVTTTSDRAGRSRTAPRVETGGSLTAPGREAAVRLLLRRPDHRRGPDRVETGGSRRSPRRTRRGLVGPRPRRDRTVDMRPSTGTGIRRRPGRGRDRDRTQRSVGCSIGSEAMMIVRATTGGGGCADQPDDAVGSPRLRRYVVTEKVVPVSREEVPVDDSERAAESVGPTPAEQSIYDVPRAVP